MTNSEDLFGPIKEESLSSQDLGKCASCEGKCCRHITISINKPKTKWDFDKIRWWLAHWDISIHVYKNEWWYLKIFTRCKYLTPENRCSIYARRPSICRDYNCDPVKRDPENGIEFVFNSVEDIEAYAERVLAKEEKSEKDLASH